MTSVPCLKDASEGGRMQSCGPGRSRLNEEPVAWQELGVTSICQLPGEAGPCASDFRGSEAG